MQPETFDDRDRGDGNAAGVSPTEYKVLVKPDPVEQRTMGGIIIPDDPHERDQMAQVKGTLVAMGDAAFGAPFSARERERLVPGARVYFNKYAGTMIDGADGEEYRFCTDKDIVAIIEIDSAVPVRGRRKGGLGAAA